MASEVVLALPHKLRVMRLYRYGLKELLNWSSNRHEWYPRGERPFARPAQSKDWPWQLYYSVQPLKLASEYPYVVLGLSMVCISQLISPLHLFHACLQHMHFAKSLRVTGQW